MENRFYRVYTYSGRCYRIRADEHYNGIFANVHEWELYVSDEYSTFRSWTFLTKCSSQDKIGNAIKLNINDVKRIEPI